jgi:diaminohydroxyphosphoribosylaminopyrimidine deaminase/5-amino-6-(5-phosphoribosylamino)uracil reductase
VWITGEAARRDVQFLRAQAGAMLTGIGTVLADDPSLNVRLTAAELGIQGEVRQPTRIVLDSSLQFPLTAAMLKLSGDIRVYTCSDNFAKITQLEQAGINVRRFTGEKLVLADVMTALVDDGITEVHVEAGATLSGALVEQGFADELVIYLAPHLMGSSARALFNLPHINQMEERLNLTIRDIRAVGQDWRMIISPQIRG